jgi:hypothetical protein
MQIRAQELETKCSDGTLRKEDQQRTDRQGSRCRTPEPLSSWSELLLVTLPQDTTYNERAPGEKRWEVSGALVTGLLFQHKHMEKKNKRSLILG